MNSAGVFRVGATSGVMPMVAVWLVSVSSVYGQCETHKLLAEDGAGGDYLGLSVAVSGDAVLIGAPKVDHIGFDMGAAYVFRRNGAEWAQAPRLLAADATLGDHGAHFGYRGVAIDGDTAVIGAPFDYLGPFLEGNSIGSAYVFRFDGSEWVQEQKLMPSDGDAGDRFGWRLAVTGNTIAVGSREDDDNGIDAGAVYVYEFDGNAWVERQKLFGSEGGGVFGSAVVLDGDRMLVGAFLDDTTGPNHGAAYTFHRQDGLWTLEQLVVPIPADRQVDSWYGHSLALDGEVMVIGAPLFDAPGQIGGAAFVFRFDGSNWVQEQKLLSPDPVELDGDFGWSVGVSGDTALIGAFGENDNVGAAHVFAFDGSDWAATAELVQSDAADPDPLGAPPGFGTALSLVGSTAAIAAPYRDTLALGGDQGAVYMFDMDGLTGDWDADCDVDLSDFEVFVLCSAGPDQPPANTCPAGVDADLDGDGDVDRTDFVPFQIAFTGD